MISQRFVSKTRPIVNCM